MDSQSGGRRLAFLFGCGDYESLPKLQCSRNDVDRMGAALKSDTIGEFDPVMVMPEAQRSYETLASLEPLLTQTAGPEDTILIYFSGHGKQDVRGQLYLATQNTVDAALDATSVAFERIAGYLQRSRSQRFIVILDCCYSGAVKGVFHKGAVSDAINNATAGRGLFVMTSSTDKETSQEKEGERNSVFTNFLLEGLETGRADLDGDGLISADEAYQYTFDSVKALGVQNPMKFNLDARGDLVLAKNRALQAIEVPKDPVDREKFVAIKTMIDMLRLRTPTQFVVLCTQYFIENEPYGASALGVTTDKTPNARATPNGFECDAFFEPSMLTKNALRGKEVVNGIVKVRMRIEFADIWGINGVNDDGQQISLYLGTPVFR